MNLKAEWNNRHLAALVKCKQEPSALEILKNLLCAHMQYDVQIFFLTSQGHQQCQHSRYYLSVPI